ncbi:MAG: TonB-dependent receptor plug domain-containing protein [Alistipes indistinctus]
MSPNSGVDLRQISTDNIESVEVIRGIPSAEYGDLTAGAVIVNSKAGKEPLSIRFKTNPNVYQFSANKGLVLGEKAGNLNIGADYAYNVTKPTEALQILSAGDRQTALFECMARREMALEHLSRLHLRPQYDGTESR